MVLVDPIPVVIPNPDDVFEDQSFSTAAELRRCYATAC